MGIYKRTVPLSSVLEKSSENVDVGAVNGTQGHPNPSPLRPLRQSHSRPQDGGLGKRRRRRRETGTPAHRHRFARHDPVSEVSVRTFASPISFHSPILDDPSGGCRGRHHRGARGTAVLSNGAPEWWILLSCSPRSTLCWLTNAFRRPKEISAGASRGRREGRLGAGGGRKGK